MEIIANALQAVASGANVLFTDTVVGCGCNLLFREGSGLVTLKGATQTQCRARYKITFGANVALPDGATVAPISLALAINGEAIPATTMIQTPAAVEQFSNIFSAIFVDVPRDCCFNISVKNTSEDVVEVQNANMIVERVA